MPAPTGFGFPGPYDVYVPNTEASGGLIVGYSRDAKKFPVNGYIQIFPSDRMIGMYWIYTSRNAARIVSPTDTDHLWPDGDPAPPGSNNLESFTSGSFKTARRAYPWTLGELTVEQMSFDLIMTQMADMAQQCMTARTMLTQAALTGAAWGPNAAYVNPSFPGAGGTGILAAGQDWTTGSIGYNTVSGSTNAGPNIKICLQYGQRIVHLSTIGAVNVMKDLSLVVNPTLAMAMASSTEIQDYLKQSPFALKQLMGDEPPQNAQWGLPDRLYSVEKVIVEDAVRVSLNKTANDWSVLPGFVMGDTTAYLLARQGKLEGLAGSRSFSTVQLFFFEDEMTAETLYEVNNRRYLGRVISNYVPIVASTLSAFQFLGCQAT
jgi:hypothetical protein